MKIFKISFWPKRFEKLIIIFLALNILERARFPNEWKPVIRENKRTGKMLGHFRMANRHPLCPKISCKRG
jgi:hypothetical protein